MQGHFGSWAAGSFGYPEGGAGTQEVHTYIHTYVLYAVRSTRTDTSHVAKGRAVRHCSSWAQVTCPSRRCAAHSRERGCFFRSPLARPLRAWPPRTASAGRAPAQPASWCAASCGGWLAQASRNERHLICRSPAERGPSLDRQAGVRCTSGTRQLVPEVQNREWDGSKTAPSRPVLSHVRHPC